MYTVLSLLEEWQNINITHKYLPARGGNPIFWSGQAGLFLEEWNQRSLMMAGTIFLSYFTGTRKEWKYLSEASDDTLSSGVSEGRDGGI